MHQGDSVRVGCVPLEVLEVAVETVLISGDSKGQEMSLWIAHGRASERCCKGVSPFPRGSLESPLWSRCEPWMWESHPESVRVLSPKTVPRLNWSQQIEAKGVTWSCGCHKWSSEMYDSCQGLYRWKKGPQWLEKGDKSLNLEKHPLVRNQL